MENRLKPYNDIDNISIEASFILAKQKIKISFTVQGMLEAYVFPKAQKIQRVDELWKATCFELFLANDEEVYYELNFSSSLGWNFYVLESYREEPKELEFLFVPTIKIEENDNEFRIVFELKSVNLNLEQFKYYNLATILLSKENERTFWAIKHLKTQPDFHDKKSFLKIS
jgi:hypothetical protein